jgi:hypothetical protein
MRSTTNLAKATLQGRRKPCAAVSTWRLPAPRGSSFQAAHLVAGPQRVAENVLLDHVLNCVVPGARHANLAVAVLHQRGTRSLRRMRRQPLPAAALLVERDKVGVVEGRKDVGSGALRIGDGQRGQRVLLLDLLLQQLLLLLLLWLCLGFCLGAVLALLTARHLHGRCAEQVE